MKKTILIFLIIFSCIVKLTAQNAVPNAGFENWSPFFTGTAPPRSYELPDQWKTTDSITVANSPTGFIHSATKEISLIYSGSYSLHLQSWSYYFGTTPFVNGIPGCATNGDVLVDVPNTAIYPISGTADTVLHAQLNGFYRYAAGGSGQDTGSVEICMFKRNASTGNRDTVATGKTYLINQGTYTQFGVNLSLYGSASSTPDSMLIWIQSSPRNPLGSGQTGSILLIDSLTFSGILGVNDNPGIVNSVHIYPIPAVDLVTVEIDFKKSARSTFELIDIAGRKVLSHEMNSTSEKINLSGLNTGNYFYHLLDDFGNKLSSGKIAVNK